jgi:ribonuclease Z
LESGEVTSFNGYSVSCFDTDHGIPSFGYIMEEDVRRGRFDKKKAMELGLKPSDYSKLQNGEAVGNIEPSMIIGPSRPGLKLVYTGDTHPCDSVLKAAKGADLLIHESTYASGELRLAIEHRHSTAVQAANTAKDSGCRHLILTHISNRYDSRALLESEAKEIFRNSIVADDLNMYSLTDGHLKSV